MFLKVDFLVWPPAQGKPVAVCQYNNYRGGGIIAVDYEARKYGWECVTGVI